MLAEAEAVVNSRPITYVADDLDSQMRILRPVDFLNERQIIMPELADDVSPNEFGEAGKRLLSVWKQRSKKLDRMWKTWYEDYLLSLRELGQSRHERG